MPIYDYECRVCGHVVEVIHRVNETGPTACERCGGPMRKLLTQPAIVFRGSGWAKNDARAARPAERTQSESGSDKGAQPGNAGADTKRDSSDAPATKATGEGESGSSGDRKGSATGKTASD